MVSFKKAALKILEGSDEPLTAKEITKKALNAGYLKTEGITPEATMGAQLYVDINSNKNSPFIKAGKGLFSLKAHKNSTKSPSFLLEKQNQSTRLALKERLHSMDPYQFEYLISDLLQKIGYEDVEVTRRSGDGGIDIIANLTVGGLTNVKTVVQVKRFRNNLPGKIITQLRGSAEVDQRGLVITTSSFTKDAKKEAKASNKMPVSLVNGEKLLDLLFRYGIGIKKQEQVLYSLDTDYFENEDVGLSNQITSSKNRSIWPLPGGTEKYVETLNMFLDVVGQGINTKDDLVNWYKKTFDTVQSNRTAEGYIFVPKSMGLINITDGRYSLTEAGKSYLRSKDLDELYEIISHNIFAFDEILEFIRTSKEPQNEQTVLNYLSENFDVGWTTFAQTNFRLLWLLNLGKLKKVDEGYISTRN